MPARGADFAAGSPAGAALGSLVLAFLPLPLAGLVFARFSGPTLASLAGAALEVEGFGQRQDREVGALRGGAEDHGLGIADLAYGWSPSSESTIALLVPRAPAAGAARGGVVRSGAAMRRARPP